MPTPKPRQPVPGTTIFDGEQARKGYALSKMCYSFNDAGNRRALKPQGCGGCARSRSARGNRSWSARGNIDLMRPLETREARHGAKT
jgi:hypothetical protein